MTNDGFSTSGRNLTPVALVVRLLIGVSVLFVIVVVLGLFLSGPLERASMIFVNRFGLVGVILGVVVVDSIPGLTHEPFLFIGYSGGLGFWRVFAAASLGSVAAGVVGWQIGRWLGRLHGIERLTRRYRLDEFMERYGGAAVAVAALTPFPFAVCTWGGGAAGLKFRPLLLGSLFRIPKVLIYLSLVVAGWQVAT